MIDAQGLEPIHEQAIVALLTRPTRRAAAAAAGISEMTLWRYMQRPDFQAAYREARRESLAQATANLQAAASEAVDVLRDVMNNARLSPYARVQAAAKVLDMAYRALELEDIEARIAALEREGGQ